MQTEDATLVMGIAYVNATASPYQERASVAKVIRICARAGKCVLVGDVV